VLQAVGTTDKLIRSKFGSMLTAEKALNWKRIFDNADAPVIAARTVMTGAIMTSGNQRLYVSNGHNPVERMVTAIMIVCCGCTPPTSYVASLPRCTLQARLHVASVTRDSAGVHGDMFGRWRVGRGAGSGNPNPLAGLTQRTRPA
jgi:hypothetical protein